MSRVVTWLLALSGGPAAHATASFFPEWRRECNARVAELLPRAAHTRSGLTGVSVSALAEELGVSIPRASILLSKPDRHFGVAHAERLGARFGVKPDHLLATDLLDRYGTSRALEDALPGEPAYIKDFMIDLYVRHRTAAWPRASDGPTIDGAAFVARWRREVNARLARALPPARTLTTPLMAALGRPRDVAYAIVTGRQHLTYDQAEVVGGLAGRTAQWVLADDLLAEFPDPRQLARAVQTETRGLRLLLLRLYVDRGCEPDLGVTPRRQNGPLHS